MQEWRRTPGVGRYAHREYERRFLVNENVPSLGAPWWIEDRYIDGTTLRLRQLTAEGETVHELPSWLGDEVTHDDRYSGGRLARMSTIEVETLLNSAH